jgi:hypothetical protein
VKFLAMMMMMMMPYKNNENENEVEQRWRQALCEGPRDDTSWFVGDC